MTAGWKILIALLLCAAAFAGGHHMGYGSGVAKVTAKWQAEKLERAAIAQAATDENRRIEQRRQSLAMEAVNAAKKREQDLRRDADGARGERDGLRDELAASRGELSRASCEAVRNRAAALTDVFDQCVGRYQGLAEKAGRHASDALMFSQAWPADQPPQPQGAIHGKEASN
jgi:hypothetical protein